MDIDAYELRDILNAVFTKGNNQRNTHINPTELFDCLRCTGRVVFSSTINKNMPNQIYLQLILGCYLTI